MKNIIEVLTETQKEFFFNQLNRKQQETLQKKYIQTQLLDIANNALKNVFCENELERETINEMINENIDLRQNYYSFIWAKVKV